MATATTKYHPTIGIECHVQLKTKTKLFSAVANDARDAPANTLISHIDLGMPGALPVLNEQAVYYAMRLAYAFNTEPQKHSFFERKHYFYPDLPKGYQITQLSQPIIKGGYVEVGDKRVQLNRVQLEEDAGKNIHPAGQDYSLVDLNRAGTPLVEIVSEPDMHTAAEAKAYARELYLLVRYADVSDADLYHGNMRFDVNVSLSAKPDELGIRTETKNLNSFRSVEKAVEYEIKRQTEELVKGNPIVQETRGWDEAKQKTVSQRGKEEAHDYRYMPEPDIPPLELDQNMIANTKKEPLVSPNEVRDSLSGLDLTKELVEEVLEYVELAQAAIRSLAKGASKLDVKNSIIWELKKRQRESNNFANLDKADQDMQFDKLITVSGLWSKGVVSSSAATSIAYSVNVGLNDKDPYEIAKEENLLQVSDKGEIERVVAKVIAANPQVVADVHKGEMKAIGFLVGQVMQASQGRANPQLAQEVIKRQIGV